MQYWSLFILGVDIETSTIIVDFSSFNLTSETCEAPTVSFLCSRFSYLDVRLLCIALSNSGSAGWVFQICWFVLFFLFFFSSSDSRDFCFLWQSTWIFLRDFVSVIADFFFFFWHKCTQTLLPNCRYAKALLTTLNLSCFTLISISGKSRL